MSKSKYSFEWNYSKSLICKHKGFGKKLNYYFAALVNQYCVDFVPWETGTLGASSRVSANEERGLVTWMADYAGYQYTGDNGTAVPEEDWARNRNVNPLATSYWDKAMWQHYGPLIGKKLNQARKEYSV